LVDQFGDNLAARTVMPCDHLFRAALLSEPTPCFVDFSDLHSIYCYDCYQALNEERNKNWDEKWQRTCDLCGYWEPKEIFPMITFLGPISFVGGKCKACNDTHKHIAAINQLPNLR
jgi:hypothetical protein